MSILEVNKEGYELAINSTAPTLVKVFLPNCGPCKMMTPVIERLSEENKGIAFIEISADKYPEIPTKLQIAGVPVLVLFKNGIELGRIAGLQKQSVVQDLLDKHFLSDIKVESE